MQAYFWAKDAASVVYVRNSERAIFLYFKSEEDWGEYKYGVGVKAKGEDKEIKGEKKQYAHLISFFLRNSSFFKSLFAVW